MVNIVYNPHFREGIAKTQDMCNTVITTWLDGSNHMAWSKAEPMSLEAWVGAVIVTTLLPDEISSPDLKGSVGVSLGEQLIFI